MKRVIALVFAFLLIVSTVSCTRATSKVRYLEGEVTEISESGITVKITDSGTSEIAVGSLAFFGIKDSTHIGMADKVSLTYSGEVTETEPLRFSGPYQLEVIEKASHIEEKSPTPEKEMPKIELGELKKLVSEKGENLCFEDFLPYGQMEVGSGLYILAYDVTDGFHLLVGGGSPVGEPMYIRLVCNDNKDYIDVRYDDIDAFIESVELATPLPKGTVTEIGRGKLSPDIELSRVDAKVIFNILDGGVWEKVDTECTRDCKVVINGVLYYYHSECGAFFRPNLAEYTTSSFKKTENPGESLKLSDEPKAEVNGILEKYITLGFPDSYPEPDFYPDKFEVLISDFESVRVAKKESEEAIINLLQRQHYTEPICDCLPDVVIRHEGNDYGVKLSANEAFIRLGDSQAPLSPEDISELREILKDNQVLVSNP